ncbi:MAG: FAD-binding protein [Pseudomonadota bacterium]
MNSVMRPAADWELARFLREATQTQLPVEILGGGSKRNAGRSGIERTLIVTHVFRGIRMYEPTELVMSAESRTLLVDIEHELLQRGQMLAFEPVDLGPILGKEAGLSTIGGVISTDIAGSRRIAAGAARDHLLGVKAVSGSGEIFQSGGRVLKNVTGYDLARLVCGSWGTLAALTEVTFKVLPRAEETATLVIVGLSNEIAVEALCSAMNSPYEVSGAVHLEANVVSQIWNEEFRAAGNSVTAIRLENFSRFLPRRIDKLKEQLKLYGEIHVAGDDVSRAFWSELQQLSVLQNSDRPVWRVSTLPKCGAEVVAGVQRYMSADAYFDWSGGLIWLTVPESADAGSTDIRRVLATYGGHATLVRAASEVRSSIEVFHPMDHGTERITRGLKQVFDPAGILNSGRMYTNV